MPNELSPPNVLVINVPQQFRMIYGSMRLRSRGIEERSGLPGFHAWILHKARRTAGIGATNLAHRPDNRRAGSNVTQSGAEALERIRG